VNVHVRAWRRGTDPNVRMSIRMNTARLISCIMPTANRRRFVPQALRMFLAQDYPQKELVILDDGEDSVADLVPSDSRIRYLRSDCRQPLGAKRNIACKEARGDLIAHWDDDDWYAPARLRCQVEALVASDADLCGLDRVLFFDPMAKRAWEYVHPSAHPRWVCGATLCYCKSPWRQNPFPEINIGEDTQFVANADGARVTSLVDNRIFVGLIHSAKVRAGRWITAYGRCDQVSVPSGSKAPMSGGCPRPRDDGGKKSSASKRTSGSTRTNSEASVYVARRRVTKRIA
jgi:glycosyltransferase involved in cell wall biosynthesis